MVDINNIGEELASILLKSRSGVYQDTSENRRKHRVGQHYGKESESEVESDSGGMTKKEERLARLEKYKNQLTQIEAKLSTKGISEESRKVGEELKAKMIEKIKKLSARIGIKNIPEATPIAAPKEEEPVGLESQSKPEVKPIVDGDLNLSNEELNVDLERFDTLPLKEKKILAEKYGVSPKKKDFERAIQIQKRFNRFRKTEFTIDDLRDWSLLSDNPTQEKKFVEYADQEPRAFLEFLLKKTYENLEKKNLVNKIPYASMKNWNYAMTWSDKYAIGRYLAVKKYLEEHTAEALEAKDLKERNFKIIHEKLVDQTKGYKAEFVRRAKASAGITYDRAPEIRDRNKVIYNSKNKELDEVRKELREKGVFTYYANDRYKSIEAERDRAYSNYSKARAILRNTREEYIKISEDNAIRYFDEAMVELGSRIQEKGVNAATLNVHDIWDDPKYFSLYIDDGIQKFYARSIWAAEYSEKVAAHLRFIITTRKDKRTND